MLRVQSYQIHGPDDTFSAGVGGGEYAGGWAACTGVGSVSAAYSCVGVIAVIGPTLGSKNALAASSAAFLSRPCLVASSVLPSVWIRFKKLIWTWKLPLSPSVSSIASIPLT